MDDEDVPADYDEAEKWLKKAAEQGLMMAQFTLGNVYYGNYGDGFEKDIEQSFFYFSLAAEQGFAPAQFYLGFMYQDEFVEP